MNTLSVGQVLGSVLALLRKEKSLFVPFAIVACAETLLLILLHLAPRPPVSLLLAPPIRSFFGEYYLHYPMDLMLLPRLFQYAQMAVAFVLGSIMTGTLVSMIQASALESSAGRSSSGANPAASSSWLFHLKTVFPRYLSFFLLTVAAYSLVKGVMWGGKGILDFLFTQFPNKVRLFPRALWTGLLLALNIGMGVAVEILFVYAAPSVVIEKKSAWAAAARSFQLVGKRFWTTALLVVPPILFYLGMVVARGYIPFLMERTFPEISLWVIFASIVVSFLVNTAVVSSATLVLLRNNEN